MPTSPTTLEQVIYAAETVFLLTGLYGIWAFHFRGAGYPQRANRLPHWPVLGWAPVIAALMCVLGGLTGSALFSVFVSALPEAYAKDLTFSMIMQNAGLHLGVLAGMPFAGRFTRQAQDDTPPRYSAPVAGPPIRPTLVPLAGFVTFSICILLLIPVGLGWKVTLESLGIEVVRQDLVAIFGETDDHIKLFALAFTAVVIAPLTEELVFRAGVYRFLRTRLPKWAALGITAVGFAALHANLAAFAPLLVLSLLFCLAYERTGSIWVSVVAHGLFNLNTVVLILAGIDV